MTLKHKKKTFAFDISPSNIDLQTRNFLLYNFPLHNSIAVSRKGDTYMDGGDDGEEDEPEPDEDVDLLVDDVERQDAQTVDGLDRA